MRKDDLGAAGGLKVQRRILHLTHCRCAAACAYTLNFLILSIALLGGGASTTVAQWFMATLVSAVGMPASWQSWYRSLYAAAQQEVALSTYARFFIHMSIHLFWCLWMLFALPKVGFFSAGA